MDKLKHALKFGTIAAAIMISGWLVSNWLFVPDEGELYDFETGEFLGYAAMILALTAVFAGIKNYRDKQLEGIISFKEAFIIGIQVVLVASVIYVIGWMIYFPNFMADFPEQYTTYQMREYEAVGLSGAELSEKKEEMAYWMELYQNPWAVAGFTFLEIFPIGLVVALISALILKKTPLKD